MKKGKKGMPKKLRIAVLYNEPSIGTDAGRKFITESGQISEELPAKKGQKNVRPKGSTILNTQETIDLSEIGVVEEMDDIKAALNALGYKTTTFNVDSDVHRMMDHLRSEKPDIIFNLVESIENDSIQEMNVAGMFELLKIPYTGASPLTLGLLLNKPHVKEILTYHGILTPKFQVFTPGAKINPRDDFRYPLFVKPAHEDASVGIDDASVCYSVADLRKRIRFIHAEFEQAALVEEYIDGRELNVALMGYKKPLVLPISEIDFSGLTDDMHKIVSYAAKWMHGTIAFEGTQGVCPAALPPGIEAKVKEIALQCFTLFGCRDYARIDFRLTSDGIPYVLEVNPNPDISDDAGFARSAKAYGYSFQEIVGKIIESALERTR